jgi:hypothetical protein
MFAGSSIKLIASALILTGFLALGGSALAAGPAPQTGQPPAQAPAPTVTPVAPEDLRVVQGDQVVTGGNFTLQSGEVLRGDLTVFGGNVVLEENSRVEGSTTIFGGDADINGTVTRDLTLMGGSAHLRSGARIEGKQTALGGSVTSDPGAVVSGQSTRFRTPPFRGVFPFSTGAPPSPFRAFFNVVGDVISTFVRIILITLLAVAVAALFPANVARVAETAQQQWLVAGSVGIFSFVAVPVVLLVLAVTVCLIPAAILLAIAGGLALLGGWTVAARLIGERLATGFRSTQWSIIGQTALGAVVLAVVGALPIIGWIITFLATALGVGALILTFAGTRVFPAPPSSISQTQLPSQV